MRCIYKPASSDDWFDSYTPPGTLEGCELVFRIKMGTFHPDQLMDLSSDAFLTVISYSKNITVNERCKVSRYLVSYYHDYPDMRSAVSVVRQLVIRLFHEAFTLRLDPNDIIDGTWYHTHGMRDTGHQQRIDKLAYAVRMSRDAQQLLKKYIWVGIDGL